MRILVFGHMWSAKVQINLRIRKQNQWRANAWIRLAQDDVNPHTLRMLEGTFSLGVANNTKTRLFKYIENFKTKKGKFSDKKI